MEVFLQAVEKGGTLGLALAFLALYVLERQDRLRLQRERDALLERILKALNDGTVGVNALSEAVRTVIASIDRARE